MNKSEKIDKVLEIFNKLLKDKSIEEIKQKDFEDFGISRKQLESLGGISLIKKVYFPNQEKDMAVICKLKETSEYITKLENQVGQSQALEHLLISKLTELPKIKIKAYKAHKKFKIKRAVNVILSDLHIGSDLKKEETGELDFGKKEESRRLAKITKELIEYKEPYRKETELNVLLLGDIIQGSLHDPRDGAPTAEQVSRAIFLLNQVFSQLASAYPKVNIYHSTGNHGRNLARHQSRAVNQKWDSIETIIAYALKSALSDKKNINFHIPKTPYITYSVFGKKIFATHGDTVLKPGYPNKSIQTQSLENQINKINATLEDKDEYSVFAMGHVHVGSITHLANGSVVITNGALVPSDEFAVSIGLLENSCGQYLFESVKDFPVGDCRFIKVGVDDDTDISLDKIIVPFEGF